MADRAAIGIDIGGTTAKGGVVNASGEVAIRAERRTDATAGTKSIIATIEDLLRSASEMSVQVEAIGVGAAGFIDAAAGTVTFSPNLVYDDPRIAEVVRARFSLPAVVENDANAAVWGEVSFGAVRGLQHVAMLTLGTGVGSGFVSDGRLLRGATGAGAEFGHTVVDPEGPPCPCGLRGCLEQFASGTALARMATLAIEEGATTSIASFAEEGEPITALHVARAALEMDELARDLMRSAGTALGVGLSNIANVFDPEAIVLGGSLVRSREPFLGPARDQLAKMTSAQRRRPMRLEVTSLEGDAGFMGAASLALAAMDG